MADTDTFTLNVDTATKKATGKTSGFLFIESTASRRLSFSASCFDDLAQAALAASSGILVDQVVRSSAVKLFACQSKFSLSLFAITSFGSHADRTNLGSHVALHRFVADAEFFVLTKSFFGGGVVWHVRLRDAAEASKCLRINGNKSFLWVTQYGDLAAACPESTFQAKMPPCQQRNTTMELSTSSAPAPAIQGF